MYLRINLIQLVLIGYYYMQLMQTSFNFLQRKSRNKAHPGDILHKGDSWNHHFYGRDRLARNKKTTNIMYWWRRWESNPRPEILPLRLLHV